MLLGGLAYAPLQAQTPDRLRIDLKDRLQQIDPNRIPPDKREAIKEAAIAAKTGLRKVSMTGEFLPLSANSWECVRDVRTQLTWEVKKPDSMPRSSTWGARYTNDTNLQPGVTVEARGECVGWATEDACRTPAPDNAEKCRLSRRCGYCNDSPPTPIPRECRVPGVTWPYPSGCERTALFHSDLCRTDAYVAYANEIQLCGYTDWRMPMRQEVQTMSSHGGQPNRCDDRRYFPYGDKYRTLSTGDAAGSADAFLVYPDDYSSYAQRRSTPSPVRLVRGQMVTN